MRYVIDLQRTADNRIEGVLRCEGEPQPVAFSGWMELLTLIEPPPLDAAVERAPDIREGWPLPGCA